MRCTRGSDGKCLYTREGNRGILGPLTVRFKVVTNYDRRRIAETAWNTVKESVLLYGPDWRSGELIEIIPVDGERENMQQAMNSRAQELQGNPFAGLAQGLESAIMNAVQFKPGTGLYVLLGCLVITAFITVSRVIARLRWA